MVMRTRWRLPGCTGAGRRRRGADLPGMRPTYRHKEARPDGDQAFPGRNPLARRADAERLCTRVSSDFRTRTVRRALDETLAAAMGQLGQGTGEARGQLPVAAA